MSAAEIPSRPHPTGTTQANAAAGAPAQRKPGDPYCANCGYSLVNLTESSRCPECGKPLVEVLARWGGTSRKARRYRSEAELFGIPIISIARGPRPEFGEIRGRAVGIIAIGDIARGGIAIGGNAVGVVAIGGLAVGVVSIGGMSVGALASMGGMALGGFAVGGFGVGGIATGGSALGVVAQGGMAVGVYGRGGGVLAMHGISNRGTDPEAVQMFTTLAPVLGGSPTARSAPLGQATGVAFATMLMVSMLVGVAATLGHRSWVAKKARGELHGVAR